MKKVYSFVLLSLLVNIKSVIATEKDSGPEEGSIPARSSGAYPLSNADTLRSGSLEDSQDPLNMATSNLSAVLAKEEELKLGSSAETPLVTSKTTD